jgi:hypothetical protein
MRCRKRLSAGSLTEMGVIALAGGGSRDRACIRWSPPGFALVSVEVGAEVMFMLTGCFFPNDKKGEKVEEKESNTGGPSSFRGATAVELGAALLGCPRLFPEE